MKTYDEEKALDEFNQVHRNIPQLLMFLIDAAIMIALFARGTGKTHGVTATWVYLRAKYLPRSQGFILSQSYAHLIDTIIPQMQQGWSELGLEEDKHYWIRKTPPKELLIPKPYLTVDKPEYFIFWINGSVTKLVSLDRKAMVNSKSFDYGAICEGRKLDGKEIQDSVMPTLRGGRQNILPDGRRFGDLYQHHSILIETDLPHDAKGRWVLEYQKQVDHQTVSDMMKLQHYKYLQEQAIKESRSEKIRSYLKKVIEEINNHLCEMRKDLVFVGRASTLDNIHALGIKTLKNIRRNLSPFEWDISILNIELKEIINCFYRSIDKDKHGYNNAIDYDYIDTLQGSVKRNWKWDKDLDYTKPLIIAMDCNNAHNCMGVMQLQGSTAKVINYKYLLSEIGNPTTHKDVAKWIAQYYKGYPQNEIIFVYNNTMIAGEKDGLTSKAMDVEEVFKANNYKIKMVYLGQAMEHEDLISYWDKFCKGELPFKLSFNILSCETLYDCWKTTGTKIVENKTGRRVKKNKAPERNPNVPPQEAPHATEMSDQLLHYIVSNYEQPTTKKGWGAMAGG